MPSDIPGGVVSCSSLRGIQGEAEGVAWALYKVLIYLIRDWAKPLRTPANLRCWVPGNQDDRIIFLFGRIIELRIHRTLYLCTGDWAPSPCLSSCRKRPTLTLRNILSALGLKVISEFISKYL